MKKVGDVIVLVGKMRAGKTTLADHLVNVHGYEKVSFADPIRDMFRAIGLTTEQLKGEHKEEPNDLLCGRSPRYAMQTLGTEWARNIMSVDFWTNIWRWRVSNIIEAGGKAVTDDCRFLNEGEAAEEFGAQLIKVERSELVMGPSAHHSSELEIDKIKTSYTIENNKTIEESCLILDNLIKTYALEDQLADIFVDPQFEAEDERRN